MRKLIKALVVSVAIFGNVFCMFATQDNEAYIQKYYKIAMREMNDYGIPAVHNIGTRYSRICSRN